ncbi:hypothetical protein GLOIN_2v1765495 [Rhizophagus irregularis DAOM 181602=DAOM 197198]|nr:hypothetical protein GLOIN_2v1765495 [Rhizophagus irregularis DAOM 181602=DAOM 197198]
MSCSKIFSGNLPELTENIINFIKYLNLLKIVTSVENWFYTASGFNNLYYIKKLIISLLKIFVENEVNLHTLEIEINFCIRCFDGILELILQNPNFIRNIKNLKLFILRTNNDNNMLIINRVLQVINLHQNLKNILLSLHSNKEFLFYQSLLSSKDSNCSNTLNTITFYRVDFKGIINLDKTIEQLNVLESVHIIYCRFLNISFIQQILNLIKPFKLKSLFINATSEIDESLLLLLQKSGGYLKNFSVNRLGSERFKLNGLQNLGQILPSKLEYLDLTLCIEASDFEVFLKNSKGTFIKKLLIRDLNQKNNNDIILPYIKKYIMKEKRVRYLNFRNLYNELFDFSDEVKEFKLYNIKVQKYNDLHFDIYQFMQKLD